MCGLEVTDTQFVVGKLSLQSDVKSIEADEAISESGVMAAARFVDTGDKLSPVTVSSFSANIQP